MINLAKYRLPLNVKGKKKVAGLMFQKNIFQNFLAEEKNIFFSKVF